VRLVLLFLFSLPLLVCDDIFNDLLNTCRTLLQRGEVGLFGRVVRDDGLSRGLRRLWSLGAGEPTLRFLGFLALLSLYFVGFTVFVGKGELGTDLFHLR
jgi:hypothetical protein